jgi:hypothetical protein
MGGMTRRVGTRPWDLDPERLGGERPIANRSVEQSATDRVLELQQTAGNRAVQALLAPPAQRLEDDDSEATVLEAVPRGVEPAPAEHEHESAAEPVQPGTLPDVGASCEVSDGVGHGGGRGGGAARSISIHGRTDANYNHGQPVAAPFPSTVTVTTKKAGKHNVFSAKGTFDVTFEAKPTITLPPVPGGLSECQQRAVQEFIDGPLLAHEHDHEKAFKSNYDGTFTATVDVSNILDTPTYRQRAMENPVNLEDQKRTSTANAASKALDPWTRRIPGLDCDS